MTVRPPDDRRPGRAAGRGPSGASGAGVGHLAVALGDRYVVEQLRPDGLTIGQDTVLSRPVAFVSLAAPPAPPPTPTTGSGPAPGAAGDADLRHALRRAAAVRAPGVATLLDGALLENRLLLVYLPAADTLAGRLRREGPLDEAAAARELRSIAEAVSALRRSGLAPGPLDVEHLPVDDRGTAFVLPVPDGRPAQEGRDGRDARDARAVRTTADEAQLRRLAGQLLGGPPALPPTGPLARLLEEWEVTSGRDQPDGTAGAPGPRQEAAATGLDQWATSWAVTVLLALLAAAVVLGIGLVVTRA